MADNLSHAQKKRKLFDDLGAAVDKMVTIAHDPDVPSSHKDNLVRAVACAAVDYVDVVRRTRATDEAKKNKRVVLEELAAHVAQYQYVANRDMYTSEKDATNRAAGEVASRAQEYIHAVVSIMPPAQLSDHAHRAMSIFGLTPEIIVALARGAPKNDPVHFTARHVPVRANSQCTLLLIEALCKFMRDGHGVEIARLYTNDNLGPRVGFSICGMCDKPKK